jgi:hypothetical protein
MEGNMNLRKIFVGLVLLVFVSFFLNAQTSPEEFLGHKVGADRKLADYNQIQAYFQILDEESGKIKILTIGKTTLGKPMIMAVITSEKNMAELDKYRQISKRLSNTRDLAPDEAKQLAKEGKIIVLITCTLHATEIGGSQESMEFAHRLVTGNTPFDADKVLDEVIVLLVPTANPDGQQMVTDWYRKNLGTNYEGGPMPWLYHHYAGHDNNRDGNAINLVETRAISSVLHHDWFPHIYDDKHQTSTSNARCFVPPFIDPADPNIHPLLLSGIDLVGANMVYDLQKKGLKGVTHARNYASTWYKGALTGTAMSHNIVTVFSEMASIKVATPIYINPNEIPELYHQKSLTFPDPWPGGWWRLGDIVEYELNTSLSLVETAFHHKEDFMYNSYKMGRDAIELGKKGDPYGFIFPQKQADYPTTLRMLDILLFGGAEIHQAKEDFVADGKNYPAGSFVILMSQPYRPYVVSVLEKRKYPFSGNLLPWRLQDNASHTLPMQMGVSFSRIAKPFAAKLNKLENIPYPTVTPPSSSPYIVLDSRVNASYPVVISLLGEKAEVFRTKEVLKGEGFKAATGSFLIKNTPQVQKALPVLQEKWHFTSFGVEDIADSPKASLKNPRVAIYQSWRSNMDEGWTRFVFDDFEIPFTTLHNKDFKASGKRKVDLKEKFDVVLFSDEGPETIKEGLPTPGFRYSPRDADAFPLEYQGGIGNEGIEALKAFVEQGGILVALNHSSRLFIEEFKIPVNNALEGVPPTKFFCPTSLLKIYVDNKSPIGYGMPAEAAAMFYRSLAYTTRIPSTGDWERKVVASYPDDDILLRGWILGEDLIARRAAVIDAKYKKGHIILIGFRCQHRAQTHGTYKFIFNALLYPQMD